MQFNRKLLLVSFSIMLMLCAFPVFSQTNTTLYRDSAIVATRLAHQQFMYNQAELYTGQLHEGYLRSIEGSPYFLTDEWVEGELDFRGVKYYNVKMKFDKYISALVVLHFNGYTPLEIEQDGIESFAILNHKFRKFGEEQSPNLPTGVYRILTEGAFTALVQDKVLLDEKVSRIVERSFIPKDVYYLLNPEGLAYYVTTKKDLRKILGITNKEYQSVMKPQDLSFKKDKGAIIKIVTEYKNNQ